MSKSIDRVDFAIFMSIYIAQCKYELGEMDYDTYLACLEEGLAACKLIHEQEKEKL